MWAEFGGEAACPEKHRKKEKLEKSEIIDNIRQNLETLGIGGAHCGLSAATMASLEDVKKLVSPSAPRSVPPVFATYPYPTQFV